MLLSLSKLIAILLPATEPIRWLTFGLILLPLGIFMGVPFAAGLRHLERTSPGWIPWAWAVNGAFSGISGVAAAMIALDAGFQVTLATGWVAYAVAYVTSSLHPKTTRPD
jgi:hypothetical protein